MRRRRSRSSFFLETVAGRGGLAGAALRPLLAALEPLYAALARRRGRRFEMGRAEILRAAVPVVSVGNLTVGGTGKSPMVEWLARRACEAGLHPGILCRGYGRARGAERNDEATWLAEVLPEVPLVCAADRARGAQELVSRGARLVLLDDGFQHRRLARDFDLVLLDGSQPFGHEHLLPRGLLREPPEALRRAHALVLTRCDQVEPAALRALEARLAALAPELPRYRARHAPAGWIDAAGERGLEALPRGPVGLISALARPAAFERTVRDLGFEVLEHLSFPDHHLYAARDLAGWESAPRWLTTTKDWVKLRSLAPERLHALRIELRFEGPDPWAAIAACLAR
ncbi:MAG: tetraacyldisaccharide 4'-kinase [Planctomycetes bacterium]|nr:tetraacyldisaccharide 4'-kinase [Planctomycetota bacterium]